MSKRSRPTIPLRSTEPRFFVLDLTGSNDNGIHETGVVWPAGGAFDEVPDADGKVRNVADGCTRAEAEAWIRENYTSGNLLLVDARRAVDVVVERPEPPPIKITLNYRRTP